MSDSDEKCLLERLGRPATDGRARLKALDALRHLGTDTSLPLLSQCLASADPAISRRAVRALDGIGSEAALQLLTDSLCDLSPDDLTVAAWRLGRHRFRPSGPILARCLERRVDMNGSGRGPLLRALGFIKYSAAVPLMADALKDRKAQQAAISALVDIGSPESLGVLRASMDELPWRRKRRVRRILSSM